jgi:hypothetical protein
MLSVNEIETFLSLDGFIKEMVESEIYSQYSDQVLSIANSYLNKEDPGYWPMVQELKEAEKIYCSDFFEEEGDYCSWALDRVAYFEKEKLSGKCKKIESAKRKNAKNKTVFDKLNMFETKVLYLTDVLKLSPERIAKRKEFACGSKTDYIDNVIKTIVYKAELYNYIDGLWNIETDKEKK